jgi:hypothetical protein
MCSGVEAEEGPHLSRKRRPTVLPSRAATLEIRFESVPFVFVPFIYLPPPHFGFKGQKGSYRQYGLPSDVNILIPAG